MIICYPSMYTLYTIYIYSILYVGNVIAYSIQCKLYIVQFYNVHCTIVHYICQCLIYTILHYICQYLIRTLPLTHTHTRADNGYL